GLLGDLLLVGLGRGVVAFLGRDGGERGAHREQRQQGEGQAEAPGPACIVCVFHGVPQLIYRTSAEALSVVSSGNGMVSLRLRNRTSVPVQRPTRCLGLFAAATHCQVAPYTVLPGLKSPPGQAFCARSAVSSAVC